MAQGSEASTDEQMSSAAAHSRDEDEAGMGMGMEKGGGGRQVKLKEGEIDDLWLESEGADVACFAVHPQGNFIAVGRLDGAVWLRQGVWEGGGREAEMRREAATGLRGEGRREEGDLQGIVPCLENSMLGRDCRCVCAHSRACLGIYAS